jgi:hypothetical protein
VSTPARSTDLPDEELSLLTSVVPCPFDAAESRRLEFSSRGDRVPASLLVPAVRQLAPVVLLQPGDAECPASRFPHAVGAWLDAGVAVASVDLPLHGERSSSKLTQRLLGGLGREGGEPDGVFDVLWAQFIHQAVWDLGRLLDALAQLGSDVGIAANRVACAATGLGAVSTAAFCGGDTRPTAAALAPGAARLGTAENDACTGLSGFSPRPLAIVGEGEAAQALASAAGPGAASLLSSGGDEGAALRAMTPFLLDQLVGGDASGG